MRLTEAMAKGGALKSGRYAAAAQTSFDCWMQEAEENFQPKHIAACRNNFYGAMTLLEAAVEKRQMVAMKAPKKKVAKKKKGSQAADRQICGIFRFQQLKTDQNRYVSHRIYQSGCEKGRQSNRSGLY